VAFLMKRDRDADALEFVEAHRARLLAEKTGTQHQMPLPSLAKARGESLLSYWLAPEQSYLWVVAPGKPPRAIRLGPSQPICNAADAYLKAILDLRDPIGPGRALYDLALGPAKDEIPPGNVAIVPDDCLNRINLETLVTPEKHFWLQDMTVEIAPSLRLL